MNPILIIRTFVLVGSRILTLNQTATFLPSPIIQTVEGSLGAFLRLLIKIQFFEKIAVSTYLVRTLALSEATLQNYKRFSTLISSRYFLN